MSIIGNDGHHFFAQIDTFSFGNVEFKEMDLCGEEMLDETRC